MLKTIIANNCMGGCILSENNLAFNTPTINVQFMPEEFPRFCKFLKYYVLDELKDYREPGRSFSEIHERELIDFYGCIPDCPIGIIGDIVLVFKHYEDFKSARDKWNERKWRINYENIGYLFMIMDEKYKKYGEKFVELGLPNSAVLTQGFDIEGGNRYDVPEGYHCFDLIDGKRVITQNFDIKAFLEGEDDKNKSAFHVPEHEELYGGTDTPFY